MDILGTRWELNQLTIFLTQEKLEALKVMLSEEFPPRRQYATPRELTPPLLQLRFFLRRRNDDVDEYYKGLVGQVNLDKLGPGIQMDLACGAT